MLTSDREFFQVLDDHLQHYHAQERRKILQTLLTTNYEFFQILKQVYDAGSKEKIIFVLVF